MDNDGDLVVFNMNEPGNIKRCLSGENISTTVSNNVKEIIENRGRLWQAKS